ncbi:hypothetical protein QYM36_018375 [Artemia franciscana]|uniref:Uncharacterized protein n=1 Tax=Artemia franciscana TaxID=6661 RepID=A0AA88KU20_ARTSF|nr:hypothetical protein QYM36_018375 [Artemia franciscana]
MDDKATPGCPWMINDMNDSATAFIVSHKNVAPFPKIRGSAKRANRRKGKTAVTTYSPDKKRVRGCYKSKKKKKRRLSRQNEQ